MISSPVPVTLTDDEHGQLVGLARAHKARARLALRARIVLGVATGEANAAIARRLGVHVDTVRKWRTRFATGRIAELTDAARSGRPRRLAATVVAGVKALACSLPAEHGLPLSRWSSSELARAAVEQGLSPSVSSLTVRHALATDAIKPWQHPCRPQPDPPDELTGMTTSSS